MRHRVTRGSWTQRGSYFWGLGSFEERLLFSQVTRVKRLQHLLSFIYYSYLSYSKKDMQYLKATLEFKKLIYRLLKSN